MSDAEVFVELEVPMEEEMVAYLDGLSAKLSLNGADHVEIDGIVRAVIGYLIESDIDLSECRTEDDVIEALRRSL